MNPEVANTLNFALQYLRSGNLGTAKNILNQISRKFPNNVEVLKLLSTTLALSGETNEALVVINKAIKHAPSHGLLYLVKGNILSELDELDNAVISYRKALQFNSNDWEIHNNIGNVFQKMGLFDQAVLSYDAALKVGGGNHTVLSNAGNALAKLKEFFLAIEAYDAALKINPSDYEVLSNKGNALISVGHFDEAESAFKAAIFINKEYPNAHLNLANLYLSEFKFELGWPEYEWRFLALGGSQLIREVDLPRWTGSSIDRLLIIGEQGVGDQILHSSMLKDLRGYAKTIAIIIDGKLVNIFSRSFPEYKFYTKDSEIDNRLFDAYLPLGSLGKFFRQGAGTFSNQSPYILNDASIKVISPISKGGLSERIIGLSWRSSNKKIGFDKSISLRELLPILSLEKSRFINLQYGETKLEQDDLRISNNIALETIEGLNLYDDVEGVLSAIASCDIVVTTSNTTAHLAGALGKETLLLLPKIVGKFWYWHDLNGKSLWYPSIRVFRQEKQGDWTGPVNDAKEYLEKRFAS